MCATTIRIQREEVEQTETFKSLSNVLKKITSSRDQISHISHAVNVATNIGFKKWEHQSNANWRTKEIVKELLNKK